LEAKWDRLIRYHLHKDDNLLKPGPGISIAVGGAYIHIVHYFDHGYLEEEKSMMHSLTVTFGAKYLTGMVTSVPLYETFRLIKNHILHQSKNYKNHFENSNSWGMWPLGHVGHVTYSFINMLFISMGIFAYHSINNILPWVIWW